MESLKVPTYVLAYYINFVITMNYINSNDSIKSVFEKSLHQLFNLPALRRLMKTPTRYLWALNPLVRILWRMYPIPAALPLPETKGRRMNPQAYPYLRNLPAVERIEAQLFHSINKSTGTDLNFQVISFINNYIILAYLTTLGRNGATSAWGTWPSFI